MKKILIPTDFSVASLQLIDFATLNFPNTELDIVLVCGFRIQDSKWGMTQFSSTQEIKRLESPEFLKAKNDFLKEKGISIHCMSTELYTGTTDMAFQSFCDSLEITDGLVPNNGFLNFQEMKIFDTTALISNCIKNTISVQIEPTYDRMRTKLSISNILNL